MTQRQAKLIAIRLLRPRDIWRPDVLCYRDSQAPCHVMVYGAVHGCSKNYFIYSMSARGALDEFDRTIREDRA